MDLGGSLVQGLDQTHQLRKPVAAKRERTGSAVGSCEQSVSYKIIIFERRQTLWSGLAFEIPDFAATAA